jgi:threonine/homoserine/homoserine lactone efflux protein
MTNDLLLALSAFAFVSSITPGPNNLMLMTSGANFGFVRTLPHAAGVTLGIVPMVLLIGLGAQKLFQAFPITHVILQALCVAYLLYLAWKIATAAPASDERKALAKPMSFTEAALIQWLNPKCWTMALTAVTAFAPPGDVFVGYAVISAVFVLVNLPSASLWMGMGVQMRKFLAAPRARRVFNIVAALLLVGSLYPMIF